MHIASNAAAESASHWQIESAYKFHAAMGNLCAKAAGEDALPVAGNGAAEA
jgi:hypothetical protein